MRQIVDQAARDSILADDGNIVISASAGSGKTTIMVKKMGIELNKIIDHRTVAAVTFTVKATEEIKRKAAIDIRKPFVVMTNDSFIENEIIRPFITDAAGIDYKNDYTVEYGAIYKFDVFSQGTAQLKSRKILGGFRDNKKNFSFMLALAVLRRSIVAQEYVKAKYATIFIDEYQDSDSDMHKFFMYLKNQLNIKIFIVGDAKQAIYLWRGAMSTIFNLLASENFNTYELVTNFRCDKDIENFANLLHNTRYYESISKDVQNLVLKAHQYSNSFEGLTESFCSLVSEGVIDPLKEITIISNFNNDAMRIVDILNECGFDFVFIPRTPLDEGLQNGQLLKELAYFSKNESYSIYDLLEKTGIDERNQTRIDVNRIIGGLKKSKQLSEQQTFDILNELSAYLDVKFRNEEVKKFYESISDERYEMAFQLLDKKHKVMTVFAAKGLEFEQVVSFSRYYNLSEGENEQNHYVCVTRAKNKFIMFVEDEDYLAYILKIAKENNLIDKKKLFRFIEK